MIKIIHTADNHLGAQFKSLGELAQVQRKNLLDTFQNTIDYAIEEKASLLLISGDLFDSNYPSLKIINFVKNQFLRLQEENIEICILPGTHDFLSNDSIYLQEKSFYTLSNLKIFNNTQKRSFTFPFFDLTIHANPLTSNKSTESPLRGLRANPETKFNIALAHGSVQVEGKSAYDDWPITLEEIENSQMDYIALGHFHSFSDFSKGTKAFYPGSPEPLGFNQTKPGHIIELNLNEEVDIKPVQIGKNYFQKEKIDLSNFKDLSLLEKTIKDLSNKNLILSLELTGITHPDLDLDPQTLKEGLEEFFFYLKIEDSSSPSLNELNLENFKDNPLLYEFIKISKDQIENTKNQKEKELLQRSLQIGIKELSGQKIIE